MLPPAITGWKASFTARSLASAAFAGGFLASPRPRPFWARRRCSWASRRSGACSRSKPMCRRVRECVGQVLRLFHEVAAVGIGGVSERAERRGSAACGWNAPPARKARRGSSGRKSGHTGSGSWNRSKLWLPSRSVVPAKVGTHAKSLFQLDKWIPAFAGMTLRSFTEACNSDFFTHSFAGMTLTTCEPPPSPSR